MVQIIRCDICNHEVAPGTSFYSSIRYWNRDKGEVKEIAFDTCEQCYEHFMHILEDIPKNVLKAKQKDEEYPW